MLVYIDYLRWSETLTLGLLYPKFIDYAFWFKENKLLQLLFWLIFLMVTAVQALQVQHVEHPNGLWYKAHSTQLCCDNTYSVYTQRGRLSQTSVE